MKLEDLRELFIEEFKYNILKRELEIVLKDVDNSQVELKFLGVERLMYFGKDRDLDFGSKADFSDCNSVIKTKKQVGIVLKENDTINSASGSYNEGKVVTKEYNFNYLLDTDVFGLDFPLYISANKVLLNGNPISEAEEKIFKLK